jgi:osmotically-inducible protein OsmY
VARADAKTRAELKAARADATAALVKKQESHHSLREISMKVTPPADRSITKQVESKLAGRGLVTPCRVTVATRKGEVTLSGSVRNPQQKEIAVQVALSVSGVRTVINQLVVKPATVT